MLRAPRFWHRVTWPRITPSRRFSSIHDSTGTPIQQAVAFLKNKGVYAKENPVVRDDHFACLQNPDLAVDPDMKKHYLAAQKRALRLVDDGNDLHSETPPADAHALDRKEFPGYNLGILEKPDVLVQRFQKSSLCYMHAPAVVQYYAIWTHLLKKDSDATSDHGMLNLTQVVRAFPENLLQHHVFDDIGGNSHEFLHNILPSGSIVVPSRGDFLAQDLQDFGPGLVSGFTVHSDFWDQGIRHHYGQPSKKREGYHAMVLIGARRDDETGQRYFLLQNWWKSKQFVEVDAEYLKACRATVWFIETPQTEVPTTLPTQHGHWFETESLDKPESCVYERVR